MENWGLRIVALGGTALCFILALSCGGGDGDSSPGPITLVSVNSSGVAGSSDSEEAAISGNGRYVVFVSYADNLVPGDTNSDYDVFLRDLQQGLTSRVSVSTAGTEGFGKGGSNASFYPAISSDGRYVVFEGEPVNFVPDDTNGAYDIFMRDTQDGITSRVSVSAMGTETGGGSYTPDISSDGRYVVFVSEDGDLVPGDANGYEDVFLRDMATDEVSLVSGSTAGVMASWDCIDPTVSDDGRYVAFASYASNLVAGDTNGTYDVFVRDTVNDETIMVSVNSSGIQGDDESSSPAISGDGRFVVYQSRATNLVTNDNPNVGDIFLYEMATGSVTLVSVSTAGVEGNGHSSYPEITPDGRYVAFESRADNLVAGDAGGHRDVFVRDTVEGTTTRVSVSADGEEANMNCNNPAISDDGRYVVFESEADNLVPDPVPAGNYQVYRAPNP